MDVQVWSWIMVGGSFALYIGIAIWSRAKTTGDFYVAAKSVHPVANGMATGADWMSAASFISMAGIIAFAGRDGARYLMGWTGGYVLLALLLAPYLRKFGKFTVPDFVGERYYSNTARIVAAFCGIFVSFTYVAGQMKGVGIAFSRFFEVPFEMGVVIGMGIVFVYAVLGGMKGITYTQVAQYCVLIIAYLIPAIFIALLVTGNPIPQIALGGEVKEGGYFLDQLDKLRTDLGISAFTAKSSKSTLDVFMITMALMVGTAGLPHVIIRFFTVRRVTDARVSAFWALFFIAILYTTAPAVGAFSNYKLLSTIEGQSYAALKGKDGKSESHWLKKWEETGLIAWYDRNGDGKIQIGKGVGSKFSPSYHEEKKRGSHGQLLFTNADKMAKTTELVVNRDIMVLANPEIADLPNWVAALVIAGGLAAALSTAAGLLLVISTSLSHDLLRKIIFKNMSDTQELLAARIAAAIAIILAGLLGIYPLGFVAQVVAFAFGLAASSFFPVIILGIFNRKTTREGAIAGMLTGIAFTTIYIVYYKFVNPKAELLWGISPEGIGTLGMLINFVVTIVVSKLTPEPPKEVQEMVESIRYPKEMG